MRFLVSILTWAFFAYSPNAQIATLTASDSHDGQQFGKSVDFNVDGSMLLVGAVGDDEAGDGAGAAYVFERSRNDWVETDKILNPDPVARFGEQVWLSDDGTRALISGSWCNGNSQEGRAWVYRHEPSGWVVEERLRSVEPEAEYCFADDTTLSGDGTWAFVSDPREEGPDSTRLFRRTGNEWEYQRAFPRSRHVHTDRDGSIAMFVPVGISPDRPEAIIYERSGGDWTVRNEIETDVHTRGVFGTDSALSDDGSVAVFGSPTILLFNGNSPRSSGDDGLGAFVFRESSGEWVLEANLPPTGASGEAPGASVDISGDGSRVVYGAPAYYYPEASFHVFDWQGGSDWLNVRNHYSDSGQSYSSAVAISKDGQWAAAGSPSGESFVTVFGPSALPVELTSFTAQADGSSVHLAWETASETNNAGFEVQMWEGEDWQALGFVEGHGTTTEAQTYSYAAIGMDVGTHTFRLRQIDFDGAFEYSPEVEATIEVVGTHQLSNAYPNPFNPTSQFTVAVSITQQVKAELFNTLGQRVAILFDGRVEANQTQYVTIDGAGLASGMYVVRVSGKRFRDNLNVTLMK